MPNTPPPAPTIAVVQCLDKTCIDGRITHYASHYGINEDFMRKIVVCENRDYDPLLQSYHKDPTGPNGRENSWGLVQIHLPSWKDITKEQATDVEFSLDFLAKKMSEGHSRLWTCARS